MSKSSDFKSKVSKGIIWSALERFSNQAAQFFISILIARLLLPADYGVIAMIAIFLSISQSFVDCGFSNALIHKIDRNQDDYSTVFYFNIIIAALMYGLLFLAAPFIASFYEMPILTSVTRIIGLSIIIKSLVIVPNAILIAKSDFKRLTYASFPATICSGALGIYLAYNGFGVWALVGQQMMQFIINTSIVFYVAKWKPSLSYSLTSFKNLFKFGSKILASGLIDTIYNNIFTLIIGKIFSARTLGLYSRAKNFPYFISINITSIIQRSSYPVLCELQNDDAFLVSVYRKYLRSTVWLVSPILLIICALAKPLVITILTENWIDCVPILQILCFSYLISPVTMINNNIYQVKGRTDLFLRLEVYKKIIGISVLLSLISFGIYYFCAGLIISGALSVVINMHMASKVIPLTVSQQVKDFLPCWLMAFLAGALSFLASLAFRSNILSLFAGTIAGSAAYLLLTSLFMPKELSQVKHLFNKKPKQLSSAS